MIVRTYTICLTDIACQRVVIVGGGAIAARKARGLRDAGAATHPTRLSEEGLRDRQGSRPAPRLRRERERRRS